MKVYNKFICTLLLRQLYAISMRVYNIEDTEVFGELLKKLAESHYRRKITIEELENLKITLMDISNKTRT